MPEDGSDPSRVTVADRKEGETTDWYNNQSSLNGAQARIEGDGILPVVVSAKGLAGAALPSARKVPLSDVRACYPPTRQR
jgi:hypothetical protein